MNAVPQWRLAGDWFDICSCDIPCPCEFAQRPTGNHCQGVLAWHVREGQYGDVNLDGLTLVALGEFEGNLWAGEAKVVMGMYLDEKANERQREALQAIFGGQAGGCRRALPPVSARCVAWSSCRSLSRWRATSPPGGSRFLASSSGMRKRFPVPQHHPASGCRQSTRRARRSARAKLPPGGVLSR
ncbi:hypothetical protein MES5069_1630006 [Mesorhizobium escarrei]|uniref:DUF1326 domain-containing protein n=1 Tax=Mesorhizobium escarrei TaxID=666018 RepID=A0ABM9DKG5_9HYPH|nr:hypothetical protein MES5069_1630006 [Mesorhizobium escarrei]